MTSALLHRSAQTARRAAQHYGAGLFRRLTGEPVFLWAQAIAFKVIVTLLPLILLATGIFGLVLRQENPFDAVAGFLRTFLPPDQSAPLIEFVFVLQRASGTLTVLGSVGLLVAVLTLFSTLRYVIAAAMGESHHRMRRPLRGWVFDLRMIVQVGTLFILSFGLTLGVSFLNAQSGALAEQVGLDPTLTAQVGRFASRGVSLLVPYLLTLGMLGQLYRFVPRPRAPFRSALVGAAVAAVLFELSKNGFAIYATYLGNFNRYDTAGEGLGGLGGVFGLILAFGVWVYLSGLILIIGAIVTSLHERRHEPRRSAIRRRRAARRHMALRSGRAGKAAPGAESASEPHVGDGVASNGEQITASDERAAS
jgi:membrane protein